MENHNDAGELLNDVDLAAVAGGGLGAKIIRFAIGLIAGKAAVDAATDAPSKPETIQEP